MVQVIVAIVAGLTLVAFWTWRLTRSDIGYIPPPPLSEFQILLRKMTKDLEAFSMATGQALIPGLKAAIRAVADFERARSARETTSV